MYFIKEILLLKSAAACETVTESQCILKLKWNKKKNVKPISWHLL